MSKAKQFCLDRAASCRRNMRGMALAWRNSAVDRAKSPFLSEAVLYRNAAQAWERKAMNKREAEAEYKRIGYLFKDRLMAAND
jgi:hypothetical protein